MARVPVLAKSDSRAATRPLERHEGSVACSADREMPFILADAYCNASIFHGLRKNSERTRDGVSSASTRQSPRMIRFCA